MPTNAHTSAASPSLARRQLARQLRSLRERARLTREDVARTRVVSRTKLEQIEYGKVSIKLADVRELGLLYGATDDEIEAMRDLAQATNERSFWQEFSDSLPRGFDTFLGLEAAASETWVYEPSVIYGFLQTREYALAVERASDLHTQSESTIEGRVQVRLSRYDRLVHPQSPLKAQVLLGEAALRLQVGDEHVMRKQWEQLVRLNERENIEISILPFSAGPHPALGGGLVLLDFPSEHYSAVAYIESHVGARYTDLAAHVDRHREIFKGALSRSISLKEFSP